MTESERSPLTRAHIVDVALAIADRDGLDGLTMRRLSAELGVSPPVVYRHFADKASIVVAIVEYILRSHVVREPGEQGWRPWLRETLLSTYRQIAEHPGVLPLLASTEVFTVRAMEVSDRILAALQGAGLDAVQAGVAFRTLMGYMLGQLILAQTAPTAVQSLLAKEDQRHMFKNLTAMQQCGPEIARVDEAAFAAGVDLVLDQVERMIPAEAPERGAAGG